MVSLFEACEYTYLCVQLGLHKCEDDPDWITKLATRFYHDVGDSGKNNTGWYSYEAYMNRVYEKIDAVEDHYLSPRMGFRAAYHKNKEVLTNYPLFKELFFTSRKVINVTKTQNDAMKYINEGKGIIKVRELSIHKYSNLSESWIKFDGKNIVDESKNFPLLDNLWDWFTEYEKSVLIK